MINAPPIIVAEGQRKKDLEHVQLLAVFHFIVSGLAVLGIAFLYLHHLMMKTFMTQDMWKGKEGGPPKEFFAIFIWFYWVMGVLFAVVCVANVLSGLFLQQRKHRKFSLIVAGLDCVQFPFGTTLGVFTILVLLRDSVRQLYGENPAPGPKA